MTVAKSDVMFGVESPEELMTIIKTTNLKQIYKALDQIDFSYSQLFRYLNEQLVDFEIDTWSKVNIICSLMEISESTLFRWRTNSKTVDAKHADKLTAVMGIFALGTDVFESKQRFVEWLSGKNFHLDDRPPLSFIDSNAGIQMVEHLLYKIEYGVVI